MTFLPMLCRCSMVTFELPNMSMSKTSTLGVTVVAERSRASG